MKATQWLKWSALPFLVLTAALVVFGLWATPARANDTQPVPGLDGTTRSNIFDNTQDGLQVPLDPIIGFVVQRQPKASDLTHIEIRVHLQKAAPNCTFSIELVIDATDVTGGLEPGSNHGGIITVIGAMTTNGQGNGSSGAIVVLVTKAAIFGESPAGALTFAHIDVEPNPCGAVVNNQYGSAPDQVKGHNAEEIHWLQPA